MVFLMLPLKEELIGRYGVVRPILADLHFDGRVAVRAEERAAAFVESIETVQLCDAVHHHGIGVRQRFPDLTHPFSCDVGGAHDDAEGFPLAAFFLRSP